MSHHSALTPEEWKLRTFEPAGLREIAVTATESGIFIHTDEFDLGGINPHKMMALCNLALTLDENEKYEAPFIAMPDVAVCQSAAWYFRKLARELIAASKLKMDPEERASFLDHARSLTDGNEALFRLSETLKALVPPE
jgi:hypothetical protein